jgi:transposase-like protein
MKAMAPQRSYSIEFKRQVAQEFIAGESLYALSKRHDISRQTACIRCCSMSIGASAMKVELPGESKSFADIKAGECFAY